MFAWILKALTQARSGGNDPTANSTSNKALDFYQEELDTLKQNLNTELKNWENQKIALIAQGFTENNVDSDIKCDSDIKFSQPSSEIITSIFKDLLSEIKKVIQSPSKTMDNLLKASLPHINKLDIHLRQLCDKLNQSLTDYSKTPQEIYRERIEACDTSIAITLQEIYRERIEVCDTSISIINEMIQLTENIEEEINAALSREEITEEIIKTIVQFLMQTIAKIPLPSFDIDLKNYYRTYLFNQIEPSKINIEKTTTQIEGDLGRAMKEVSETSNQEPFYTTKNNNVLYTLPVSNESAEVKSKVESDKLTRRASLS